MGMTMNRFLLLALLCCALGAVQLSAQATASTGSNTITTGPGVGYSFLDEYYFDVDFGSGTVTPALSATLTWSDSVSTKIEVLVTDPLATMGSVSQQPDYDFTVYLGYDVTTNPPTPMPTAGGGTTSGVLWGPGGLYSKMGPGCCWGRPRPISPPPKAG